MEVIEGKMPFMGYETYYRIVGRRSEKTPLVLLHGGPGSSHNYFFTYLNKNNEILTKISRVKKITQSIAVKGIAMIVDLLCPST